MLIYGPLGKLSNSELLQSHLLTKKIKYAKLWFTFVVYCSSVNTCNLHTATVLDWGQNSGVKLQAKRYNSKW